VNARKIALLVLIVAFAASVETAWNVGGDMSLGPEGCRVMGGRFYGPSWAFETTAEREITAGVAPRLEIENSFGAVRVGKGAPGVVKVRLRKVVFLPTEEKASAFAERIELRLTGDGERVRVSTNRAELGRGEQTGFETHLEIEAPAETVAEVRNEHGRVELTGLAGADVASSFEGVEIAGVAGDVKLEARHGGVSVERVGGGLQLSVRHGDVSVSEVVGSSKLDVKHGSLGTRSTASLEIELAHGELTAASVGGDLVVRSQHAPVSASDVTGRTDIETSFGDVRLERVGGDVHTRVQHGKLTASDVSGGLNAETTHDGVELERVLGPVEVKVQHGGLEAKGLAAGARVQASGADVAIDGFAGKVDVEVERGSARLAPGGVLAAELIARATHGDIELDVPEGRGFELEAESRRGQVNAPLQGLDSSDDDRRRGQRVVGRHGTGGPSVRLTADGDVTLEPRPVRSLTLSAVQKPRAAANTTPEEPAAPMSPKPVVKPSPALPAEPKAPPQPEAPPEDPGKPGHTR